MFESARIKLTLSYLGIIMLITLSFSAFVYIRFEKNSRRALEAQRVRMERQFVLFEGNGPTKFIRNFPPLETETLSEIRHQTLLNIITINALILFASGSLGYILAGRTLRPIEEMVKKQKRFISDAAHEIKTPLTAMKTNLEVTLRDKKLTVLQSKDALKSAIEEIDRLNNFTSRLLKKSKYQKESLLKFEKINLDNLLNNVVNKLNPLAEAKNIAVDLKLDTITMIGAKEELEELFTNLIENSIKYNKQGGRVYISSCTENKQAVVTVEDFGVGINEQDISNIFEPFYRADTSRADSVREGFGLGLAIAKEIVDRHNGSILVESKINEGSKFTIKLPLEKSSQ